MFRIAALFLALLLVACEKDLDVNAIPQNQTENVVEKMDDLVVPAQFDWATENHIQVNISSSVAQRIVIADAEGGVLQQLWLTAGQTHTCKLTLGSRHKSIRVSGAFEALSLTAGPGVLQANL